MVSKSFSPDSTSWFSLVLYILPLPRYPAGLKTAIQTSVKKLMIPVPPCSEQWFDMFGQYDCQTYQGGLRKHSVPG